MADTRKYLVLIERADDGKYGAHAPDLPGCVVVGYPTPHDALDAMATAIEMHIQGMIEDGDPIPVPATEAEYIEAAVGPGA